MPQLTGLQTGTSQSDLCVGEINIVDLTEEATDAGIQQRCQRRPRGGKNTPSISNLGSLTATESKR